MREKPEEKRENSSLKGTLPHKTSDNIKTPFVTGGGNWTGYPEKDINHNQSTWPPCCVQSVIGNVP